MLTAGQSNNVSFKVNVMGTSSEPRVRVILGASPELSFVANRDGEKWFSSMDIPGTLAPGSYDLRVEVVLNNRLFTPVNKKIEVKTGGISEPAPAADPEVPAATVVQVTPATEAPTESVQNVVMPTVVAKMPKIEPKVKVESTPAAPATLSLLSSIAKATPKKKFEAIRTPLPKPTGKPAEPIRVKISEIDAVTSKAVSHVVEACAEVKKAVKRVAKKSGPPVKLVKEQLFYE